MSHKPVMILPWLLKPWYWYWRRNRIQKVIILGVLLGLGWWAYRQFFTQTDATTYHYAPVAKRDLVQLASETGAITSTNKIEMLSSITGHVTEVLVTNGQSVKRGDPLFYVISSATQAQRSKAWADYLTAQATLKTAQATAFGLQATMFTEWDQYKELAESDSYKDTDSLNRALPEFHIPQKEWLAAEGKYKTQEQVIAAAQSTLTKAWLDYQATVDGPVLATADGTVANLHLAVGQEVNVEDAVLVLKTQSENWVEVAINENDITQIHPDQRATITVDALEVELPAVVKRVDEFGTEVSDVMVYYVYLTLEQEHSGIRPGMTVQVDIVTQEKSQVLAIPSNAIKPYQGEKAVQIMDKASGLPIYQPVQTGIADQTHTEILSGLAFDQEIIVSSTSSEDTNRGGLFGRPRN